MTFHHDDVKPRRAAPSSLWRSQVANLLTPLTTLVLTSMAVIGLIWVFGGWESIRDQRDAALPVAGTDQLVTAEPFILEVTEAFTTRQYSVALWERPGHRWVVVTTLVSTTSPTPVPSDTLTDAFTLDLGDGPVPATQVTHPDDEPWGGTVQPGMTKRWLFAWAVANDTPLPPELRLLAQRQTYRASALADGFGWFDPTPEHAVVVPLRQEQA